MKKIYVLAAMAMFGSYTIGQSKMMQQADFSGVAPADDAVYTPKAQGISLWSSTFDTPADWTIGGDGQQGDWVIGTNADPMIVTDYTFYGPMASTTANDGFAFFDGVPFLVNGAVDPQNAWIEMTNPVDCSGYNRVILSFEQRYMAFNSDFTYVEVSVDNGASWQGAVDVNADVPTNNDPAVQNTIYQEFQVNGATQVKFRFRWENASDDDNFGSGYAWMVDDVNVSTLPDNDISTSQQYYGTAGLYYFQIPETQIAPIDFTVNVRNAGINAQTGVQLEATETGGSGYTSTSPAVSVAPDATDSLVVASAFTPAGQGTFNVDFAILNDATDDIPSNNQLESYAFEVGQNIYARDTDNPGGSLSGSGLTPPVTIEVGPLFDIFAADDLYAIDVTLGSTVAEGIEIYGTLYEIDPNAADPVFIGETDYYMTGANDANASLTLPFPAVQPLEAGKTYMVTVASFATDFSVATSGFSPDGTSLIYGDLGSAGVAWYFTNSTPVVRMNFDESLPLSVENNEISALKVSQYPNPFANETTVNYSLQEASAVDYNVVDMAGNVIISGSEGNQTAGEHSFTIDGAAFANGVYFLELTAGENKVTRRLVVNK
tara:strand:+ start:28808 stop:30616 length:1809 start_codon:yes stop_codon:yes gene_type:complete